MKGISVVIVLILALNVARKDHDELCGEYGVSKEDAVPLYFFIAAGACFALALIWGALDGLQKIVG